MKEREYEYEPTWKAVRKERMGKTKKVKMNITMPVAADGINIEKLEKGKTYDLPEQLANALIKEGKAK